MIPLGELQVHTLPHEHLSLRILQQRDEKQKGKTSCLRSLKALFYYLRVGHPGHPDSDHHL